jgi:hypothetical protein
MGAISGHKTKQVCPKQGKQAQLPCQPASFVSLSALMACLLCFLPANSACISYGFFAATTNITNINNKISGTHHESIHINEMSMC